MSTNIDLTRVITAAITAGAVTAANDPNAPMNRSDVPAVVQAAKDVVENLPSVKDAQAHYDYATSNDSPLQSYGVYGAVLSIASGLWQGYWTIADGITQDDQTALFGALGSVIAGALFIIGRYRRKPIGQ